MTPNIKRALERIAENQKAQASFLDLGNLGLSDLLEEVPALFELTHLKRLNLGCSYHFINEKGKRQGILSQNTFMPNSLHSLPKEIACLEDLEYVCCSNYVSHGRGKITNELRDTLEQLISNGRCGNRIQNFTLFNSLAYLKELDLSRNQISKLEGLDRETESATNNTRTSTNTNRSRFHGVN